MRILLLAIAILISISSQAGAVLKGGAYLSKKALPSELSIYKNEYVIVLYSYPSAQQSVFETFVSGDTVTNLKGLIAKGWVDGYRIAFPIYQNVNCAFTKLVEFSPSFDTTVYAHRIASNEEGKFDLVTIYSKKGIPSSQHIVPSRLCTTSNFKWLTSSRSFGDVKGTEYKPPALWVLSIGIDDYKEFETYRYCKSDASSYSDFFKASFIKNFYSNTFGQPVVNLFTLLDKMATKDSILGALKTIAAKSKPGDYFIFNFAGYSSGDESHKADQTYFVPYGTDVSKNSLGDLKKMISLKEFKEYLDFMPARNQLFITESGPTEKFRQEFISTILDKDPELERLLNKNRVIIIPNKIGMDGFTCGKTFIEKGPLNYYITSMDTSKNVFDLFAKEKYKTTAVANELYAKQVSCNAFEKDYFTIFFEKEFMDVMSTLSRHQPTNRSSRNGSQETDNKIKQGYGKKYALVIGTGTYKAVEEWDRLPNAVLDARKIAGELENKYGFDVDTMINASMQAIYDSLWSYKKKLGKTDQFLLYIAGHGDFDSVFLDDGMIVCSDSRPSSADFSRDSYIPFSKLTRILNNLPTEHLLLMLDVCFGGTFGNESADRNKNTHPVYAGLTAEELITEKSQLRTRRFISSGGKNTVTDGIAGLHSPFAYKVLEVLSGNGGTNGFFTAAQIYAILQTSLKSKPLFDGFGSNQPGSDFVFEYAPRK